MGYFLSECLEQHIIPSTLCNKPFSCTYIPESNLQIENSESNEENNSKIRDKEEQQS